MNQVPNMTPQQRYEDWCNKLDFIDEYNKRGMLNEWEQQFIDSLRYQLKALYKHLTFKQSKVLRRIYSKVVEKA
jgi:uncharacterized FlaG/YvyC family protein